jgi:ribosome-associated protein
MADPDDFDAEPPSKSELKRQSRDLQDLGQALVDLPVAEFDSLPLSEELRDAIADARRITSHGALVRQRLYIGKLLRRIDPEPIRQALATRAQADRRRVRAEQAIEAWRDRLLADEAAAWTELASLAGAGRLPPLRAPVVPARAERDSARPPSAARQLFRRLRELLDPADRPPEPAGAGDTMPR